MAGKLGLPLRRYSQPEVPVGAVDGESLLYAGPTKGFKWVCPVLRVPVFWVGAKEIPPIWGSPL